MKEYTGYTPPDRYGTGGISGYMYGNNARIERCEVIDTTIKSKRNYPIGYGHVGGMTGEMRGGKIKTCVFKGTVWGDYKVGGIVGYLNDNGTIDGCYTYGEVVGEDGCSGGIVGYARNDDVSSVPTIKNCYAGQLYIYTRRYHKAHCQRIVGYRAISITDITIRARLRNNRAYRGMKIYDINDINKSNKRVLQRVFNSNKNGKNGRSTGMIPIPDIDLEP